MGMASKFLAATTVCHGEDFYSVSTIDRDSSSMEGGRYAETLVWRLDEYKNRVGGHIAQDEASEGSLRGHFAMVERIRAGGITED
jgi:hypothetical protein